MKENGRGTIIPYILSGASGSRTQTRAPPFFFFKLYLFLAVLGLSCCMGSSLVAASGGYSLVAAASSRACGVYSLVAAASSRACGVNSCGAQAYLLCGMWDLPGSGIEPVCFLHWQAGSLPLHHQGSPELPFFSSDAGVSRNILWE